MKKKYLKPKSLLLLMISLCAFIPYGISQNETLDKKKLSIKPFYSVEVNFGISTCKVGEYQVHPYGIYMEGAKLSYQTLVYGTHFAAGAVLAHYFKIGLGLGYLYYKQKNNWMPDSFFALPNSITTHGLPLFLYLRSDFLDKKTSPYMDFKIGNNFLITKETVDLRNYDGVKLAEDYGSFKLKNGLFFASNIGVAFKTNNKTTINLSVGYRYVSRDHDILYSVEWYGDKDEYRKSGYIMADHQFVLTLGVSF
jgi:hypothetical protein